MMSGLTIPAAGARRSARRGEVPLRIALINNMPDSALLWTERQYRHLFAAAAGDRSVRLSLFSLPEVRRGEPAANHIRQRYEEFSALWDTPVDGMIVTGMPPRAACLKDEPYWPKLAQLVEWAEDHTLSTVWSCLAAHAAVLHIDGIARRALPEKLSGLYECVRTTEHPLLGGAPARWRVPHSRYNELPKDDLAAGGYRMLSASAAAGADIFCKERGSLFLFLQGHPEYDASALLREYHRDVAAYLALRSETYPRLPCAYFDRPEAAAFRGFRRRALAHRDPELLKDFPAAATELRHAHSWRGLATRLYRNWLGYLARQRSLRGEPLSHVAVASQPAPTPELRGGT
jgi:homoserine O-succinyltransferase/O-acetyltransferase